jgi:hypothetical protein
MSAERYRIYALDCVRLSSEVASPETKATLIDMAQCWVRLADQAEKNNDVVYTTALRLVK